MYPDPNVPLWEIPEYKPYIIWVFMGYNPQESLENTINTKGALLGVHPIAPWNLWSWDQENELLQFWTLSPCYSKPSAVRQICSRRFETATWWKHVLLLMEESLHQLIGSLSHYLQGFIHPRWLAGYQPSTASANGRVMDRIWRVKNPPGPVWSQRLGGFFQILVL